MSVSLPPRSVYKGFRILEDGFNFIACLSLHLHLFVSGVFAVLKTCMSEAMLLGFFCGQLWIDADLVDDSKHSVTTCTEDGFSRVQAGQQDASLKVKTTASSVLHWTV